MKRNQRGAVVRGLGVAAAVLFLYAMFFWGSGNALRILLNMALYCTLGQMWNLMSGYAGMTSLGQQIFIGLAGYGVAVATAAYGLPFWVGLLAGAVISALAALLLSLLLFRMSGMYFAIATWVTAEALKILFKSWGFVKMGAGMTIKAVPYPKTGEIYFLAVTLAVVSVLLVYGILNSRIGLGLTAMRDDVDAASSVGVNIFASKLFCFVVSAAVTGVAGGLFYLNQGAIFPDGGFGNAWTVAAVFIVIIGGVGTITGPIVGAVVYVLLIEALAAWPGWSMVILGVIAIGVITGLPNGIIGTLEQRLGIELLTARRHAHK